MKHPKWKKYNPVYQNLKEFKGKRKGNMVSHKTTTQQSTIFKRINFKKKELQPTATTKTSKKTTLKKSREQVKWEWEWDRGPVCGCSLHCSEREGASIDLLSFFLVKKERVKSQD